jgi:hypothetical protein
MSRARSSGRQTALHDAVLGIAKALPHHYRPPAELPHRILTLLDRMEQKPVAQRQQQPQPKKK